MQFPPPILAHPLIHESQRFPVCPLTHFPNRSSSSSSSSFPKQTSGLGHWRTMSEDALNLQYPDLGPTSFPPLQINDFESHLVHGVGSFGTGVGSQYWGLHFSQYPFWLKNSPKVQFLNYTFTLRVWSSKRLFVGGIKLGTPLLRKVTMILYPAG